MSTFSCPEYISRSSKKAGILFLHHFWITPGISKRWSLENLWCREFRTLGVRLAFATLIDGVASASGTGADLHGDMKVGGPVSTAGTT